MSATTERRTLAVVVGGGAVTLHVIVAPTMDAGLEHCRRVGLPAGRYDRSQLPQRVEILTPRSPAGRFMFRAGPFQVHRILSDGDPPLPDVLEQQVQRFERAARAREGVPPS